MSPSSPDLVCPWQWLESTCPGLLWVCHLMKTSINMGTLQLAIWLCLLDRSPPYRSAHTERAVPNQLFIHFPHCSDRPSLRSQLQGCWGLMPCTSELKTFFHPNQTLSITEPFYRPCSVLFSADTVRDVAQYSTLPALKQDSGWSPTLPPTCDLGKLVNFVRLGFLTCKIGIIIGPIAVKLGLFLVLTQ